MLFIKKAHRTSLGGDFCPRILDLSFLLGLDSKVIFSWRKRRIHKLSYADFNDVLNRNNLYFLQTEMLSEIKWSSILKQRTSKWKKPEYSFKLSYKCSVALRVMWPLRWADNWNIVLLLCLALVGDWGQGVTTDAGGREVNSWSWWESRPTSFFVWPESLLLGRKHRHKNRTNVWPQGQTLATCSFMPQLLPFPY